MKITTTIILTLFFSLISFAQDSENSLSYFEDCIVNSTIPSNCISYKYEDNKRLIVWNEKLIKSYKYSNEAFDKLGYDYVKVANRDNMHYTKVYKSCDKGIVIEVTEWYNLKLSISINWFAPNIRRSVMYLMYCDLIKQMKEDNNK